MIHGVLPPLTAITNLPRVATASWAALVISLAALRATASTSAWTSIFITQPRLQAKVLFSRLDYSSPLLAIPDQPRSGPRLLVRTDKPAGSTSAPAPQSATPLRRNPPARTGCCLRTLPLRARVRTHPSHPRVGNG